MIFTPLITLVACSLGAAANLTHVPQGVELIAPASTVSANSTFELGYDENFGKLDGFQHNVTIGLVYPNGVSHKVAQFTSWSSDDQNACDTGTARAALAKVTLLDVGNYTATWNFTYAMSSDPSQANSTYCGPGPFSFEYYVLNKTFSVTSNETQGALATITTQLPQQPTGLVKLETSSSNSVGRVHHTWWTSVSVLVAVATSA